MKIYYTVPIALIFLFALTSGLYYKQYDDVSSCPSLSCQIQKNLIVTQKMPEVRHVQYEVSDCASCQIVKVFTVEKRAPEVRYIQKEVVNVCRICFVRDSVLSFFD